MQRPQQLQMRLGCKIRVQGAAASFARQLASAVKVSHCPLHPFRRNLSFWLAAPEVSAWSEDLGGGVVRQTVVAPHARAMDGSASAVDLSHGQRPVVRLSDLL